MEDFKSTNRLIRIWRQLQDGYVSNEALKIGSFSNYDGDARKTALENKYLRNCDYLWLYTWMFLSAWKEIMSVYETATCNETGVKEINWSITSCQIVTENSISSYLFH